MSQKTFEIMNKLAGLCWSVTDDMLIVGQYFDPSDREKVRIAYPRALDSFCTAMHSQYFSGS